MEIIVGKATQMEENWDQIDLEETLYPDLGNRKVGTSRTNSRHRRSTYVLDFRSWNLKASTY